MMLFAGVYATAVLVGFISRLGPGGPEAVWPAAGVAGLWLGRFWSRAERRTVVISVFGLTATLSATAVHASLAPALFTAAAATVQPMVACAVWMRLRRHGRELATMKDLWSLLFAAAAGAVASAPFAIALALSRGDRIFNAGPVLYVLRTVAGTCIVVAVVLCVVTRTDLSRRTFIRQRWFELVSCWLVLIVTYTLVFDTYSRLPLVFLVIPLSSWVVLRFSTTGAALHIVISSAFVTTFTSIGDGPFASSSLSPAARLALAASFTLAVSFMTLVLALHRDERASLIVHLEEARAHALAGVRALEASEQRFRSAFESANVGMYIASLGADHFGHVLQVNEAMCTFLGLEQSQLIGRSLDDFCDPPDPAAAEEWIVALARGDIDRVQIEQRYRRLDDAVLWGLLSASAIRSDDATEMSVIALVEDITARKQAEDSLTRQALHDPLTGLANRTLLTDRLELALRMAGRESVEVGVLYLDLDGFKGVNDSVGHAAGDELLIQVARRIEGCVRPGDTVARLGGDEFVVVCCGLSHLDDATQIANRVLDVLTFPFEVDTSILHVGASIGAAMSDGQDGGQLLRRADEAMYEAKRTGKNRVVIAPINGDAIESRSARVLRLVPQLYSALDRGEFEMVGQPIYSLSTGTIDAVETLLRWNHPAGTVLSPGAFLDVAEDSPLMPPIGRFVLRESCRMAAAWTDDPAVGPDVHVNISGRQLETGDLGDQVRVALADTGLPATRLVLELTETYMPMIADSFLRDLQALRELGIRIAIDDVGTGYSSLARITELPVDLLKIDLKFTAGLGVEPACDAVVRAVIGIGHALGLAVVAEGVETAQQAELLQGYGCGSAQGFHYSRPVDEHRLGRLVRENEPLAYVPLAYSTDVAGISPLA
jgi:diguanylate cyclase (GGDEF)-like protein/PAS domain S-box-containing protein